MNTSNLYLKNTASGESEKEHERERESGTRKSDFALAGMFNVREINASSTWD